MSYEASSSIEERLSQLYVIHSERREEFRSLFNHFCIQFLRLFGDTLPSYDLYNLVDQDMEYRIIYPDEKLDGKICEIDYRKLSCYLELSNLKTKRTIRIFVNPFNPTHALINGYCFYNPRNESRISKGVVKNFQIDSPFQYCLVPSILFGIGEFLLGEREKIEPNASSLRLQ
jgi:hypothetical protein